MTRIEASGEPMIPIGRGTRTSRFGVGRRESHDASAFYEQFLAPVISDDEEIRSCDVTDRLFVGDARDMGAVASKSVALVVTSPPLLRG
jgi:modification methylase